MKKPRHKLYSIWCSMKTRCNNPNALNYERYGARGIKVCRRWHHFENFVSDMGERPSGTTLDRIDNDRGYSPKNCRWATISEQSRNTKRTIFITFKGKTLCLTDWATELGMSYWVFHARKKLGWPSEKILSTPLLRQGV